jgi:quercetin dioxygenase-like cupin family protein
MSDEAHEGLVLRQIAPDAWVPAEMFGLPPGCEYQILMPDRGDQHMAIICRFPPGYLEPEHTHADTTHWGVVIEGEMHVNGLILRPGDYHYAPPNVPHGPFYYPVGCTVFGTVVGPSILHEYRPEAAEIDPSLVEVRK